MGQALPEYIYEDDQGVNHVYTGDKKTDDLINVYISIEYAPIPLIKRYIEVSTGYKPRYLYRMLLAVKSLNRPTKQMIFDFMLISRTSGIKTVDYLFVMGYLEKTNRKRLIRTFGKYKVDTAYKLSLKGHYVLYSILREVFHWV
jgi:hypothetical protein